MDWKRWASFFPPRSPDITQIDFFLCGYVKGIVYRKKIRNITNQKLRIAYVITTVDEAMLFANMARNRVQS